MADFVELDCSNSTLVSGEKEISILQEVSQLHQHAIELRRWFHSHAELSFQEFLTAEKVVDTLKSYGITEIYEKIGKTGVVGVIRGANAGPCIAFRADMDALPITETAEIDYKSKHDGVMHACGHDGHMTGLLIAAKILQDNREKINGAVKLVFQPAEEGYGGAPAMIEDGVLEGATCGPYVDSVYGIHLWSSKLTCAIDSYHAVHSSRS